MGQPMAGSDPSYGKPFLWEPEHFWAWAIDKTSVKFDHGDVRASKFDSANPEQAVKICQILDKIQNESKGWYKSSFRDHETDSKESSPDVLKVIIQKEFFIYKGKASEGIARYFLRRIIDDQDLAKCILFCKGDVIRSDGKIDAKFPRSADDIKSDISSKNVAVWCPSYKHLAAIFKHRPGEVYVQSMGNSAQPFQVFCNTIRKNIEPEKLNPFNNVCWVLPVPSGSASTPMDIDG